MKWFTATAPEIAFSQSRGLSLCLTNRSHFNSRLKSLAAQHGVMIHRIFFFFLNPTRIKKSQMIRLGHSEITAFLIQQKKDKQQTSCSLGILQIWSKIGLPSYTLKLMTTSKERCITFVPTAWFREAVCQAFKHQKIGIVTYAIPDFGTVTVRYWIVF